MSFDVTGFIFELQQLCTDTLFNAVQKKRFIESEVLSALSEMEPEDIPEIRAAWDVYRRKLCRSGL